MNIFFTCKNTLVILLQMYRLMVLCLERRPQYRRQSRIFSLIPPVSQVVRHITTKVLGVIRALETS